MDFTTMTMEELRQIEAELCDEITRRVKIEERKAISEFINAFTKLTELAITVTYDNWDDVTTLVDPGRFNFTSR